MHRRYALTLLAIAPVAAALPGCSSGDAASTDLPPVTVGDKALAFGRDGTIVEIKSTEGVIEQVARGTTPGWRYGGDLLPDGRPVQPVGVLVGPARCLVPEPGLGRVTLIDRRGAVLGVLEPSASAGNRPLVQPVEGPDDRVWFVDRVGRRLRVLRRGRPARGRLRTAR